MPKLNTLALARRIPEAQTRTFIDPDYPDNPFTLTLVPVGILEASRSETCREELAAEWLDGEGGPKRFPLVGDQPTLDGNLLAGVARMWASQGGPEEDRYTPEELIAAALTIETAWMEAMEFAGDLNTKWRARRGNAVGASTPPSPAPASTTTSPLPNSSTTSPTPSGASTNGSAVSMPVREACSPTPSATEFPTRETTAPELLSPHYPANG